MMQSRFSSRVKATAVCGVTFGLAVITAGPATASKMPGSIDTTKCSMPEFSQPFLSAGDHHKYFLAPGQEVGDFNGDGWTLSGGAIVMPSLIAGEEAGSVLDLPAGAKAVSPEICVQRDFKAARAMVRDVVGSGGIRMSVSYAGTKWATPAKNSGRFRGYKTDWTVSRRINVKPSNKPGWQLATFTFQAEGDGSDLQIYDFYVDPRMKG
jgi:hypothetical protein